jgi:DNA repair exonuclease SbcCD ATPase subunit
MIGMFNSTSKNERKNLNVINQEKDYGSAKIEIEAGDSVYTIYRECEKYIKKIKGEETSEAKTLVDFKKMKNGQLVYLNSDTRSKTDKIIRSVFGDLEDFLLTSVASQFDFLSFVNEGSTKRKEVLAKFLNLEVFESKYKNTKEEFTEIKTALAVLEKYNFKEKISETYKNLLLSEKAIKQKKMSCDKLRDELKSNKEDLASLENKISKVPKEVINMDELIKERDELENRIEGTKVIIGTKESEILAIENSLKRHKDLLDSVDISSLEEDMAKFRKMEKDYKKGEADLKYLSRDLEVQKEKTSLLKEVPCGPEYSHCKFIKNAYEALKNMEKLEQDHIVAAKAVEILKKELNKYDFVELKQQVTEYKKTEKAQNKIKNNILSIKLFLEKKRNLIKEAEILHKENEEKINFYNENKEILENVKILMKQRDDSLQQINEKEQTLKRCEQDILEIYKITGSLEEKMKILDSRKEELDTLREKYSVYELFMRSMHPNGLPYEIIKYNLPIINTEISKILSNVVNFEVFLEGDGKKLDIYIKHANCDPRPIEMGSGAEKTLASIALRLALLSVSSMPRGDIFILDEPGTALDEDNMAGFMKILEIIKTQFKTIILISHLDFLKDMVDSTIEIKNINGFAHVDV